MNPLFHVEMDVLGRGKREYLYFHSADDGFLSLPVISRDMDEETELVLVILGILAVVGIVLGLVNSITDILVSLGLSQTISGQLGSFLFFLILLGLIYLIIRGRGRQSL